MIMMQCDSGFRPRVIGLGLGRGYMGSLQTRSQEKLSLKLALNLTLNLTPNLTPNLTLNLTLGLVLGLVFLKTLFVRMPSSLDLRFRPMFRVSGRCKHCA